ncbi:MAG TPA: hypothetical protein VKJ47_19415, partial [Candidatus Binatia bacterium]|nr:hypothetical protein [Candidatus Binatia bacterium]
SDKLTGVWRGSSADSLLIAAMGLAENPQHPRPRPHGHRWLFLPKRCAPSARSRLARIVSAIRDNRSHRPRSGEPMNVLETPS